MRYDKLSDIVYYAQEIVPKSKIKYIKNGNIYIAPALILSSIAENKSRYISEVHVYIYNHTHPSYTLPTIYHGYSFGNAAGHE